MKTAGAAHLQPFQTSRRTGLAGACGIALIILLLLLAMLLISCNRQPPAPAAREPIHVVAPIYVLADVARQVGADRVDVQWWLDAGQSIDELQESPQRLSQIRNADLVISRGLIDPWTTNNLGSQYETQRLIRLDRLTSSRDLDPHQYTWLDPYVILDLADELANRLTLADPRNDKMFHDNAAAFRQRVLAACDRMRPATDAARGGFLTLDRGFVPLAHRFALKEVRLEAFNVADPTPYAIKALRQSAQDASAHAIFVNDQTPASLVRDLQTQLNLTVLPLDDTGSSAPGSGKSTYVDVLLYNLKQIANGMK